MYHTHTRARFQLTTGNRRYLYVTISTPYPVRPCLSRLSLAATTLFQTRSNPIIRVLRFVRSNSVCLIIRTARLFPTRNGVCFNTPAYTRVRARASNCERYARFVSVIADWWSAKPPTVVIRLCMRWRSVKKKNCNAEMVVMSFFTRADKSVSAVES